MDFLEGGLNVAKLSLFFSAALVTVCESHPIPFLDLRS
jgi:hypothetical protein